MREAKKQSTVLVGGAIYIFFKHTHIYTQHLKGVVNGKAHPPHTTLAILYLFLDVVIISHEQPCDKKQQDSWK